MKKIRAISAILLVLLALSVPALAAPSDMKIPILIYHSVREMGAYDTLTISPTMFREHMIWLRDNGFTPLLSEDLIAIENGEMFLPERPVVITFDDGYTDNYLNAFPVLKETGMKAIIAVVSTMVNNGEWYTWGCTWDQLREMTESGLVEIGSHTHNLHFEEIKGVCRKGNELYNAYIERVAGDLLQSKSIIEENLGKKCIYFAYPFGETDEWIRDYIKSTGIFRITTVLNNRGAQITGDLYDLSRIRCGQNEHVKTRQTVKDILARKIVATSNKTNVSAMGKAFSLYSYLINGTNYVKLRDVAHMLKGSEKHIEIIWNEDSKEIEISKSGDYTAVGGELAPGKEGSFELAPRNVWVKLDGKRELLTAYNIGGNNYFNLRSLGRLLGIEVGYDEISKTVTIN